MQQLSLFPESPLDRAFRKYDVANPHIYRVFVKKVFEAVREGRQNWSARAIFNVIRWNTELRGDDDFKVNNNYSSRYTRKFESEYPELMGFLRKRKLKS